MRSLTLGNSDRALHEPLGLQRALEADVGLLPKPEEVGVTTEEALAALLNEPEPPCQVARVNVRSLPQPRLGPRPALNAARR